MVELLAGSKQGKVKWELMDIVNSGIMGTSAMTVFSHFLSEMTHENLREPDLLGMLCKQSKLPGAGSIGRIAGWHLHYGVGVVWAALYALLLKRGLIDGRTKSSIVVGAVTGVAAVAAWEWMLRSSRRPPAVNKVKFYGQLIPAHIVFALIAIESLRKYDENLYSLSK
jgi:hypothetical protein